MITIMSGDMFANPADAVVNPVNCVGVMGKGLAAECARRWPGMLPGYKRACADGTLRPGAVQVWATGQEPTRFVVQFPTKRHWRQPSRLGDVADTLPALTAAVVEHGIRSIAVPALGCGLGGLPWPEVRALVETAFAELHDVDVRLYPPQ